jgi:hypothetical protein
MAENIIFILKMVATMFYVWKSAALAKSIPPRPSIFLISTTFKKFVCDYSARHIMGSALALCLTTLYLVLLRASAFVLLVSLRPATSLAPPPLRPFLARLVWRLASVGNQERGTTSSRFCAWQWARRDKCSILRIFSGAVVKSGGAVVKKSDNWHIYRRYLSQSTASGHIIHTGPITSLTHHPPSPNPSPTAPISHPPAIGLLRSAGLHVFSSHR